MVPFLGLPPTEPQNRQGLPHLRLHQPDLHCLPHPGVYLRLHPTQLTGHLQPHTSKLSSPCPGTSSSQLWITVWLCLGTSKPSISKSRLQIALYLTLGGSG